MTTETKNKKTTSKPRLSAKNRAAIQLLESWLNASDAEAEEQRETFEYLKKALDEDRPGYRKLFPENDEAQEMKEAA